MSRSYPAPLLTLSALGAMLLMAAPAIAQDYYGGDDRYDDERYERVVVDGDEQEAYYHSRAYTDEAGVPFAGKDVGYDYLDNEFYRYEGQPVQDRRAREQDGWRDGVLHTRPRGYYRNWYDHGCGCTRRSYYRVYNSWGEHEYRQGYRGQDYRGNAYDYDRGYISYDRSYRYTDRRW